jgi:hypothetical protein
MKGGKTSYDIDAFMEHAGTVLGKQKSRAQKWFTLASVIKNNQGVMEVS